MNKQPTEKKKTFSFDKSFSSIIFHSEPDKYKSLENSSYKSSKIINMGSNLSYSPLGFSKDSLSINIKKFNQILSFNLEEKTITVEAGLTLYELLDFTLNYNLWIPQLPGYPLITIGGAIASNSHGKSCAIHGTIRQSVKQILLFHKKHGWINLSDTENKEIFDLTLGGIGLTGTIVSVTFNLTEIENSKFLTKKIEVKNLEECKKLILEKDQNMPFIYSWNRADDLKNFGKGFVYKNYIDKKGEKFDGCQKLKNNFKPSLIPIWNKFSIKVANLLYYKINQITRSEKKENFFNTIFPFYGKEKYFNFFGKKGFIESQLLIDVTKLEAFIYDFKNLFNLHEPTITLFSLKNMSGNQKFLRFEDKKICLTFDYVNNKNSLLFMSKVDDLCEKYEIIPSIIKDSRMSKNVFNKCYKESIIFKDQLKKFDKDRVYESEISKRLGI